MMRFIFRSDCLILGGVSFDKGPAPLLPARLEQQEATCERGLGNYHTCIEEERNGFLVNLGNYFMMKIGERAPRHSNLRVNSRLI